MSDDAYNRIKVRTSTLKSGIAYGIASLGAIPMRYDQARFPALRRQYSGDSQEIKLLKIGNGIMPSLFALATISSIGKANTKLQSNGSVLRNGANLGKTNGNRIRLSGASVEIACTGNVYADSLDLLFDWIASVIEHPIIKGLSEFADGGSVPVSVNIEPTVSLTDPVDPKESGFILDRLFNAEFSFRIDTIAAKVETIPLFKALILEQSVEGHGAEKVTEFPVIDPEDWP